MLISLSVSQGTLLQDSSKVPSEALFIPPIITPKCKLDTTDGSLISKECKKPIILKYPEEIYKNYLTPNLYLYIKLRKEEMY